MGQRHVRPRHLAVPALKSGRQASKRVVTKRPTLVLLRCLAMALLCAPGPRHLPPLHLPLSREQGTRLGVERCVVSGATLLADSRGAWQAPLPKARALAFIVLPLPTRQGSRAPLRAGDRSFYRHCAELYQSARPPPPPPRRAAISPYKCSHAHGAGRGRGRTRAWRSRRKLPWPLVLLLSCGPGTSRACLSAMSLALVLVCMFASAHKGRESPSTQNWGRGSWGRQGIRTPAREEPPVLHEIDDEIHMRVR